MADLTTVANVKAWSQINTTTAGDAELAVLVTAASAFIRSYTDRDFASQSYTEIRDGSGGQELFLRDGPATAVTSLSAEGQPIPAQTVDAGPGYFLARENRVIALCGGYRFPKGRNNVRVTYTAGPATVPEDIAQACAELVSAAYKRGPRGPEMKNESGIGQQTFGFSMDDIPAWAKLALDNQKRVV